MPMNTWAAGVLIFRSDWDHIKFFPPGKYFLKTKEFVDSEILSYKVFNPDSDYGHSIGNVLRQSASST